MTDLNLGPILRDERSGGFFDATAEGRLVIHRCRACGHLFGAELSTCSRCASDQADWAPASGDGALVSWVVVHRRGADGNPAATIVATVELAEGPWLTLPVDAPDDSGLRAGAAMRVAYIRPGDGEAIPVWRSA